jgi:hypothetical protein
MNIFEKLLGNLSIKLNFLNRTGSSRNNKIDVKNSSVGVVQQASEGGQNIFGEQKKNIDTFLLKIQESNWDKQLIKFKETFTCYDDTSYQIEIGEMLQKFNEIWSDVYPDKEHSWLIPVYLKINGSTIKELYFVSCDGGRIFVPIPKRNIKKDGGGKVFYWEKDSFEFKLARIIGEYDIYNSLEKIAEMSKIEIR